MKTLKDQIAWEQEMQVRGAQNYYATQDRLREKGRTEQTDAIQYVMRTRLAQISEALETDVVSGKAGIQSKYNKVLNYAIDMGVSTHAMAFMAVQVVIKAISEAKRKNHNKVTRICGAIGERIETECRCIVFEQNNPALYDLMQKELDENDIVSYEQKKKRFVKRFVMSNKDISWGVAIKVGVGAKVLQMIELVMGDILYIAQEREGKKQVSVLKTTSAFIDWCAEFEKEKGLMQPTMLPLMIPPADWDETGSGGYYTPRMNMKFPFIKTKGREHREFVEKYLPTQHISAVNKIQKTAWKVNQDVLKVVEYVFKSGLGWGIPSAKPLEIPPIPNDLAVVSKDQYDEEQWDEFKYWKQIAKQTYREEARRRGQVVQFRQTLELARELSSWDEFYFAYSCDFRGRVYCATTCLSPQSNGIARSLLKFGTAVELGTSGVSWLALHGASMWGLKGTYEYKLNWVAQNRAMVESIVQDPIANNWWKDCDEPYQFLAWCYEWHRVGYGSDPSAKSDLVVGIDGSCNGLQHFSAILRDHVGAKATNLCESDEPQDIYQEVANWVIKELEKRDDGIAELWLKVGIDRSVTKRQCMTLPYGATQQSCREYTYEWVKDNWDKFDLNKRDRWKVASYLSPVIWAGIGETVVAATVAMEWLQRNVGARYSKWISPVGFPVYQFYKKVKTERVDTRLAGKTKLTIHNMDRQGTANRFKQRLGIVPNFIHSVDASHMVMTINATDLVGYSMIHDEFGCHAGNTQVLYHTTRETFYTLHSRCNPLELWATHQGIPLEYVPQRGDFDIAEVLRSKYIFG